MIFKLAEILDATLRGAGLENTSLICRIAGDWAEIVGSRIAAQATPIRLARGELTLSAADPVWRQELTLLGPEIAELVNRNIGREVIRRIRLVTGAVRSPDPPPARRRVRVAHGGATPSNEPPSQTETSRAPVPPSADLPHSDLAGALESLAITRRDRLRADREPVDEQNRTPAHSNHTDAQKAYPWTARRGRRPQSDDR